MAADETGNGPPAVPPRGEAESGDRPPRRVALLGASNLTRGISTVVELSGRHWGRPLDILAALGHGRSYGMTSTVLGRSLPGILQCGLWPALERQPAAETAALVTDVGNDVLYGAPVERIAGWIEECLDRLLRHRAKIIITRLPICNLPRLRNWQFELMRRTMFPSCRLTLNEAAERAVRLDAQLCRLASERNCAVLEPRAEWYGLDPIHVKLRHWSCAWRELLAPWSEEPMIAPRGSFARWIYLRSRAPEVRAQFGVALRRAQPCGRLADGTTLSFF